jgi:tRNA U34 5-methylaminomethyl-2-thiouridine-forming methyltransferase MnmC
MAIMRTADGSNTLFSEQYGVTYHSRHGAVTESAHVFINAGLRYKAAVQPAIAILETGLGSGLNAFMTLLEAERRNLTVRYTALELFPLLAAAAAELDYAATLQAAERQSDFLALHTTEWDQPLQLGDHFCFEKKQAPIESFCQPNSFDLIYYDAFAPQAQPELWSAEVMSRMFVSLKMEGALVTYCAQGEFKRNLKKAGFLVEALQGPPGKREMTRAIKLD